MRPKTVAIAINSAWNIINFRTRLISALQAAGYRVIAITPEDGYEQRFEALGIGYVPIEIDKQGISPARDLLLLLRYYRRLKQLRPDIFLGYTVKPNVYGSLAAHALKIPVINNVAGLGTSFIKQGWLTRLVTSLYALAFRHSKTVFFQNCDDRDLFVATRIVDPAQAKLLPGSGIDLSAFSPAPAAGATGAGPTFLLIARLLWDKGVREYVEAARIVRSQIAGARFQILGFLDVANRTAVSRDDVQQWIAEGVIEYLGEADDVRPYIGAADCIVLPSYREGLPRALLEGAAMGKPLVATDVPGCRQVVDDGQNGYLCAARDAASLAKAMKKIVALSVSEREAMGSAGRAKVAAEFDERVVIQHYLDAIVKVLPKD